MHSDAQLHGRHRPEDVDIVLAANFLSRGKEQAFLEVGLEVEGVQVG